MPVFWIRATYKNPSDLSMRLSAHSLAESDGTVKANSVVIDPPFEAKFDELCRSFVLAGAPRYLSRGLVGSTLKLFGLVTIYTEEIDIAVVAIDRTVKPVCAQLTTEMVYICLLQRAITTCRQHGRRADYSRICDHRQQEPGHNPEPKCRFAFRPDVGLPSF
jgi:hypothetical protein